MKLSVHKIKYFDQYNKSRVTVNKEKSDYKYSRENMMMYENEIIMWHIKELHADSQA